MRVEVLGSGHALPSRVVSSEELDRRHGLPEGFLRRVSGVRSRRWCAAEESQIDLAAAAARTALDDAGLTADDVDLVLSGSCVPYQPIPAMAPLVQRALDIPDGAVAAFDVNSSCLSFVSALDLAARMIVTGQHRTVLIVSSEVASRALPWERQPDVAALFGDGAAAAVISATRPGESGAIAASLMRTYPSGGDACEIGSGGTRFDFREEAADFAAHSQFAMEGKTLYRIVAQHFDGFLDDLLARAGWRKADVDLVVPHQASPLALAHLSSRSGFAADRIVDLSRDLGNQIAASIPTALDVARRTGRLSKGMKVLMLGTSAGVSLGGLAMEF